mmetsp:Transcript_115922/g.162932  ORF Transcript_115922/g.162932 Transcript_115922/m.162932 type:complete len:212 (-) Transcript_115922:88-723(-)
MAPRYPSLSLDYSASSSSNDINNHSYYQPISSSYGQTNPVLHSNTIEFKPRLDLWASQSAWGCSSSTQDLYSQQQRKQPKQRRRVRFAPTLIETQSHIHHSDITPEEKQAAWFSRSEFKQMRFERQTIIDDMSIGLDEEWGLETSANHSIYYEIRQAQNAVLEEQDDQLRWDGYLNFDILAARYQSYTQSAKDRAYYLASYYAKEIAREQA